MLFPLPHAFRPGFLSLLSAVLLGCCLFPGFARAQVPGDGPERQDTTNQNPWARSLYLWSANDYYYLPLQTDRYYTAGMGADYGSERRRGGSTIRRGWSLEQAIFTPLDITSPELLTDDRPFSSYLTVERSWRETRRTTRHGQVSTTKAITVGTLGKYSGGGRVQSLLHNAVEFAEELEGWRYEIKPDAIVNLRYAWDKDWLAARALSLRSFGVGRAGTLFTDLRAGVGADLYLRARRHPRYWRFGARTDVRFVAWNATLSGGLLNWDERYRGVVLPERLVRSSTFSTTLRWGRVGIESSLTWLSPEFRGGAGHVFGVLGGRFYW